MSVEGNATSIQIPLKGRKKSQNLLLLIFDVIEYLICERVRQRCDFYTLPKQNGWMDDKKCATNLDTRKKNKSQLLISPYAGIVHFRLDGVSQS